LKLHVTHQLLVYADEVNILDRSIQIIKESTDALVVNNKENGPEVNADKSKYIVMSRNQNEGQGHDMKIDNSSFERVEEFKYLETTQTEQNSNQEETKCRLKSENACYNSVWNLSSSSLISKNMKIRIYRNIIFPVLYEC
jgi:hypothetical protein